jgi:hypothetical protein
VAATSRSLAFFDFIVGLTGAGKIVAARSELTGFTFLCQSMS